MLRVNCGVSGKIRIVKENSITGEVTADVEFSNVWTDIGLEALRGTTSKQSLYPEQLLYGSGSHTPPFNTISALAKYIGMGYVDYGRPEAMESELYITPETCVFTRTRSITIGARGVSWILSELALGTAGRTYTYSLVKNEFGEPEPLNVSPIEILTVYYTIQFVYPMHLEPQPMEVEGLPPTTAEFFLKTRGKPGVNSFLASTPGPVNFATVDWMSGYTTETFQGQIRPGWPSNDWVIFKIHEMNRTTEYFGNNNRGACHIWKLDPPITKNDTQELHIGEFWEFSNVEPVEV